VRIGLVIDLVIDFDWCAGRRARAWCGCRHGSTTDDDDDLEERRQRAARVWAPVGPLALLWSAAVAEAEAACQPPKPLCVLPPGCSFPKAKCTPACLPAAVSSLSAFSDLRRRPPPQVSPVESRPAARQQPAARASRWG